MDTLNKIRLISRVYSKKSQRDKAIEEIGELKKELEKSIENLGKLENELKDCCANPFGYEDLVYMTSNTWSEMADNLITDIQLIMQHGAGNKVREQVEYKVNRQLSRMHQEGLLTDGEYRTATGTIQPAWKDAVMQTFLGSRQ